METLRVLTGNLGDGWNDEVKAAHAFGRWVERVFPDIKCEVIVATGTGGGLYDDNGMLVDNNEYPDFWRLWLDSDDSIGW